MPEFGSLFGTPGIFIDGFVGGGGASTGVAAIGAGRVFKEPEALCDSRRPHHRCLSGGTS
jgi:hypothetical protein